MTAKATWVDPPSGWKYGFPKLYPTGQVHRMSVWIIDQGYPQRERDSYKGEGGDYFFVRCWHDEEIV